MQTHLLYSTLLVFIYLLLSYTNTQWVLKCMISPYNLGEGSVICAKTHSYQNSQKLRMAHTLSNTQKIWTKYNSYIYPEAPKVQRIPPPPKIKIQRQSIKITWSSLARATTSSKFALLSCYKDNNAKWLVFWEILKFYIYIYIYKNKNKK